MPHNAIPNNQEDREVYLREHHAADFIAAVNSTRTSGAKTLIMTIGAFAHEPEVLYVALDYANTNGVTITMAPLAEAD
jgi:hypothetical protein